MSRRSWKSAWFAAVALSVFAAANCPPVILARVPGYVAFVSTLPLAALPWWQPVRWTIFITLGLWLAHRLPIWRAGRELGLASPIGRPLIFCLVCSAPMIVLPAMLAPIQHNLDLGELLFSAGIWVFAEELLYRGYCFRQLHRRAGWNLYLAACTTGVVFGLAHLSNVSMQGLPWRDQLLSVSIIGAGGAAFAWLFAAWRDNLWVPTLLHALMNLGWSVYAIDEHPAAGWLVITLRVAVITIAITWTAFARRLGWLGLAPSESRKADIASRAG